MNDLDLLTTAQVAEMTGLTASHLRRMAKAGKLPALKFGHDYIWRRADAEQIKRKKAGRPPKAP